MPGCIFLVLLKDNFWFSQFVHNNMVLLKLIAEIWKHRDSTTKKSEEARNTNHKDFKHKGRENENPKANGEIANKDWPVYHRSQTNFGVQI